MSENRDLFADTAGRLLAVAATQAVIEAAEDGAFPQALWDELEDLGILSMLVSEEQGGVGADFEDAAAVLHAAGFHAAPGPIAETMVARWLLAQAGLNIPDGPLTLLTGDIAGPAAWLRLVQPVHVAGDGVTFLEAGQACEEGSNPSDEPFDRLASPGDVSIVATGSMDDAEGIASRAMAILRAAQMAGAMQWCVERSVDYAQEREQFGRKLAKMQVVQQYLAQAAGDFVAADTLAGLAAQAGPGGSSALVVAAARTRAADAADTVSALCHQVHGAIGFSREYALNLRTRRLMTWRDDGVSSVASKRLVGTSVCEAGVSPWETMCAASSQT